MNACMHSVPLGHRHSLLTLPYCEVFRRIYIFNPRPRKWPGLETKRRFCVPRMERDDGARPRRRHTEEVNDARRALFRQRRRAERRQGRDRLTFIFFIARSSSSSCAWIRVGRRSYARTDGRTGWNARGVARRRRRGVDAFAGPRGRGPTREVDRGMRGRCGGYFYS